MSDTVITAIRRLPPAAQFAISALGIACGFAAELMMPSHHATILQALVTLFCTIVALAALAVFLIGRRGAKTSVAIDPSNAPSVASVSRPQNVVGRIASLLGLAGLGGLATFGAWEGGIAVAGAIAYAGWRTWQVIKSGKADAGGVPHLFVALAGGSFIFEGIGYVAAVLIRAA